MDHRREPAAQPGIDDSPVAPPAAPRGPMSEQDFQRDLASFGHEQDFCKHLATLSTGSILLLATFIEKFFARPAWSGLIAVAIGAFLLSVLGAVVMQFLSVLHVNVTDREHAVTTHPALFGPAFLAALGGFVVGLFALGAFTIRNL